MVASTSLKDQSLLDQDIDDIWILSIQDPHNVAYGQRVIRKKITNGDLSSRDRI
jgi:hypothetical protein